MLAKANLTDADLVEAIFSGANLITTTLTGALWGDTTCPGGGKSSSGCSPFPTQPVGKPCDPWYDFRSTATAIMPSTGTDGRRGCSRSRANRPRPTMVCRASVYNDTGQRIIVGVLGDAGERRQLPEAILEPGTRMSYQLPTGWITYGTLVFLKAPEGQAVGLPVKLKIVENDAEWPFRPGNRVLHRARGKPGYHAQRLERARGPTKRSGVRRGWWSSAR